MNDLQLGIEHFNAGRFEEARLCFQKAPGPEARSFMAHALDSLGRPREAARALVALLEDFPLHLPAYSALASLHLRRGPLDDGGRTLRWLLAREPGGAPARAPLAEALKACGEAYAAAGEGAPAEKALARALALDPSDERRGLLLALLRARAQAHASAREHGAAEQALKRALVLAPDDAHSRERLGDLLRTRAHAQASARDFSGAEKSLRRAVAAAPDDLKSRRRLAELLHQRGMAHRCAGRTDEAEKALRASLGVLPGAKSRERLLEVLCRRGTEKALRSALTLDPRRKEARRAMQDVLRARGRDALRAGKPGAAEKALRRALAFEPRDNESRSLLAGLLRSRLDAALAAGRPPLAPLRAALALWPRDREARRLLAEPLRARGIAELFARRLKRAESLFRCVLLCDPRDAAACLSLASVMSLSGRRAEEKALLRRAARGSSPGDRFRALMKLGRYAEAVATAERILDAKPGLPDIRCFWDPWEWDERVPRAVLLRELRALERAVPDGPWLHYYRGSLNGPAGVPHFARLEDYPAKRYGWMYFKAASVALMAADFGKAAAWFKRSLAHEPVDWRARGFLAETYLCLHKPEAAFAEMDRAQRAAPKSEAGQVLAWRGAFELWLGRYQRALALLEKAESLGAQCAFCWKGAALLKLGRPKEALAELDRTLRLYPLDLEAYVWRGEAKRALGRHRDAMKDLDYVAVKSADAVPVWMWARFNRALAKAALKDAAGMAADYADIPERVVGYIMEKTGLEKKKDILEAGLRLSLGFRRDEHHQAIWMKP